MALTESSLIARPVQSPLAGGLRIVSRWVADRRTARARKMALDSLLFAPEHRLRDLGISRDQIFDAIEGRRK
jgi:uncharacterized protein YjiS (DUF1127 family)